MRDGIDVMSSTKSGVPLSIPSDVWQPLMEIRAQLDSFCPGEPTPIHEVLREVLIHYKPFSDMEVVMGRGGQLQSFEAVFSPRGADGQPRPLWDRKTGKIDHETAKAWERYDISAILRQKWPQLGPKLHGKLHIIVGTADTFHLNEAVQLLRDTLRALGSDASVEFIEGRDHFDLYKDGLAQRIAREMYEVARPQPRAATSRQRPRR